MFDNDQGVPWQFRSAASLKTFKDGFKALDGITLSIAQGEMVALIGASGSGKSTLLRHVSGLMPGDPGESQIRGNGRMVQRNGSIPLDIRATRADIGSGIGKNEGVDGPEANRKV